MPQLSWAWGQAIWASVMAVFAQREFKLPNVKSGANALRIY
jgi:hypothetical protein